MSDTSAPALYYLIGAVMGTSMVLLGQFRSPSWLANDGTAG
ncbi:MAG: hypothetical protein ACJ8FY_01525 [Gemmataceae bacterium]